MKTAEHGIERVPLEPVHGVQQNPQPLQPQETIPTHLLAQATIAAADRAALREQAALQEQAVLNEVVATDYSAR